jgi:hypothetical protein
MKILIELKMSGLREGKFAEALARATNRFSDCFTSAGANIKTCTATVQAPLKIGELGAADIDTDGWGGMPKISDKVLERQALDALAYPDTHGEMS